MPKSQDKKTTAKNLEEKFDHGEDVLDYLDLKKARVVDPQAKSSVQKFRYSMKRNSQRRAVVREKSPGYRKKK